jgi:hypothetical protein
MIKYITILFILLAGILGLKNKPYYSNTYWVGTGSGDLTISATYPANSIIIVKHGTYSSVNISGENTITVMNDSAGPVYLSGVGSALNVNSCNNIHVTRNPSPIVSVPYGFVHENNTYRGTSISGTCNWDTLEYVAYISLGDNAINYTGPAPNWDGTDATVQSTGLCLLRCFFDSCQAVCIGMANGTLTSSLTQGLIRYLEISNCLFRYDNGGDLTFAQPVDKYKIHDNTLINCNYSNNNDNGLFHMVGSGNIYNNYAKDCQGHMIRMWTISFMTPFTDSCYNNIYIGSRKYSIFEYQSSQGQNVPNPQPPNTTYTNVSINNNTCGDLNYEDDGSFGAFLVDNYGMPNGSVRQIHNNLLFNNNNLGVSYHIFQFDETGYDTARNWYFTSSALAGFDTVALYLLENSPALNAGVPGSLLDPFDYHGVAFEGLSPSIGAVSGTNTPSLPIQYIYVKPGYRHVIINH